MGSGARRRRPIRQRVRAVLRGGLGRLMIGVAPFELSNVAATLLILRATDLLSVERGPEARRAGRRRAPPSRAAGEWARGR